MLITGSYYTDGMFARHVNQNAANAGCRSFAGIIITLVSRNNARLDFGESWISYLRKILTTINQINMTHLKAGDRAPDFIGTDQHGKVVSSHALLGEKIVLYFYPKDDTPGCTAEACNLRDNYTELLKNGYHVLGVSPDSIKSHQKFSEKFSLPFPLIPDPDKLIIKSYGVWGPKKFMGKTYDGVNRTTFVIDEKGIIEKVISQVDTKNHSSQIL